MSFYRIGDSIRNIVYRIAGTEYRDFVLLLFGWKTIVGEILARRSTIAKIDNRTLFVAVVDSIWLQELVLRKEDIKKDIKRKLQIDLEDIVFYVTLDYQK